MQYQGFWSAERNTRKRASDQQTLTNERQPKRPHSIECPRAVASVPSIADVWPYT